MMNTINAIKKRNESHIYTLGVRKDFIRKAATYHVGRKDFNPRPAKYRSFRGLTLGKKEAKSYLVLQLLPFVLLAILLIARLSF